MGKNLKIPSFQIWFFEYGKSLKSVGIKLIVEKYRQKLRIAEENAIQEKELQKLASGVGNLAIKNETLKAKIWKTKNKIQRQNKIYEKMMRADCDALEQPNIWDEINEAKRMHKIQQVGFGFRRAADSEAENSDFRVSTRTYFQFDRHRSLEFQGDKKHWGSLEEICSLDLNVVSGQGIRCVSVGMQSPIE